MGERLLLCAYNAAGAGALLGALKHPEIGEIAVLTHEPIMGAPSVADIAEDAGLWHSAEHIRNVDLPFEPTVLSTVYYRYIVPPSLLSVVEGAAFNVHPSLLPRHRGCSSIPWAIIEGDEQTGVSYHYMEESIDTGRIFLQTQIPIENEDTAATLYPRAMDIAATQWPVALSMVLAGVRGWQQEGPSCYHGRGAPFGGEIDPSWDTTEVRRFIRAMTFPPYRPATFGGVEVASFEAYSAAIRDQQGPVDCSP